jgi:hypothetical protein
MGDEDDDIWFPAKRYGWGWGPPVKWQGWVALFVFLGIVLLAPFLFPPTRNLPALLAVVFLASLAFGLICWWKGESPGWRSGDRDE